MIYDHTNNEVIQKLEIGEFAIPNLEWANEIPLLIGQGTLSQMITNMSKYPESSFVIQYANNRMNNNITLSELENLIREEIQDYTINSSTDKLILIFHLIQLWGGNAGRMFYFRGINIDFNEYESLVKTALQTNNPEIVKNALMSFLQSKKNKFINIAFITKHIAMWQRFGTEFINPLPIYDSIIAKNIMGKAIFNRKSNSWVGFTNNDFEGLVKYWENMLIVSQELNVSTVQIERQIFNFFRDYDSPRNLNN
jgi:hypothetical protein